MVVRQPAVPRFIARHMYNFFVADEPQVPAWPLQPAQDLDALDMLSEELVRSSLDMRPVLRALFTSDNFKEAMYKKVRSPVEVVVGTLRLTGDLSGPDPRWGRLGFGVRPHGPDRPRPALRSRVGIRAQSGSIAAR